MKIPRIVLFIALFLLPVSLVSAAPMAKEDIPEPLRPWIGWVLHGSEEELLCTPRYNSAESFQCRWPASLSLSLTDKGGSFIGEWLLQHDGWVTLPGTEKNWPSEVTANSKPALVVSVDGSPSLFLPTGEHRVGGRFEWTSLPEHLIIPSDTALITASINNKKLPFLNLDQAGRLWLRSIDTTEQKIEDRLDLRIFRLVDDLIPLKMTVRIEIDVAGNSRETVLGPVFDPKKFIPLALESQVPARLLPDGRLQLQVRPGRWLITVIARHLGGPASEIRLENPADPWPDEEIWSFQAENQLRIVQPGGLNSIDPQQTTMPPEWRHFPAFRARPGEALTLVQSRRGDPEPAPDQLSLNRTLWLRFDGAGFFMQDNISGTKNNDWRLEMPEPIILGRVAINGVDQFITRLPEKGAGVEVRQGILQLVADSVQNGEIEKIPITGWLQDFKKVSATLNLPPGWQLVNASGVDSVSNTWIKRWTLLDFFLVLIISLTVARLFNPLLGLLALATLTLTYHEAGAPTILWLLYLAAIGLSRVLAEGKAWRRVLFCRNCILLGLIVVILPFAINQIRFGIYPQLERPWSLTQEETGATRHQAKEMTLDKMEKAEPLLSPPMEEEKAESLSDSRLYGRGSIIKALPAAPRPQTREILSFDPKAAVQTGPGLPWWKWKSVQLNWNGPVEKGETLSLLLLGPRANMFLAFLRVALIALLLYSLTDRLKFLDRAFIFLFKKGGAVLLLLILCGPARAAEIPGPEILNDLKDRLLEKADCFPNCADYTRMRLQVSQERMRLTIEATAYAQVAVPLPGRAQQWLPETIMLDGAPAKGLSRTTDEGEFWLVLPAGRHQIDMEGPLSDRLSFQIPLLLKPHRVEVSASGWSVEGIHADGGIDNALELKREKQETTERQTLEPGLLPTFVQVERFLNLGLEWRTTTTLTRLSPPGTAVLLEIPLLPGESITTEGVRIKDGKAIITLDAGSIDFAWESNLGVTPELILRAPNTDLWTETWRVSAGPIWHLDTSGIPVIHHREGDAWLPMWRPWPNEEVRLAVSRPEGIPGQTLTVDQTAMVVRPGKRMTETELSLMLRSSQGGQHRLLLPKGSELQAVLVNGRSQPIRLQDNAITLPLVPGSQNVSLKWRTLTGIGARFVTPAVDLGITSVNTSIEVWMPANRWSLLLGGITVGPAVLFWSLVIVIALGSLALHHVRVSPLRFRQWFLLGVGISQSFVFGMLVIVGWVLALGWRGEIREVRNKALFNLMQILLFALTVAALVELVTAVSGGLLGLPEMQIGGNGSSGQILRWYQDHSQSQLPQAWIISAPMWVYRVLMLLWALWLAFTVLKLLKWGWGSFTHLGLWQKTGAFFPSIFRRKAKTTPPTGSAVAAVDQKDNAAAPGQV